MTLIARYSDGSEQTVDDADLRTANGSIAIVEDSVVLGVTPGATRIRLHNHSDVFVPVEVKDAPAPPEDEDEEESQNVTPSSPQDVGGA